ncbi:Ankyrin repeat-containing protein [Penicillium cataractarum]|uniref:Ankyrin repeat-containing protein n=1 Tax=Penicillium cataractarum TaxID=2100454 RepID=A0A9W9V425_9EURO|nr:Ankyrin repeat-containing protein [Penicillium cataractarum]KAJ5368153.1 Ankyrin repeat-containing protein [Penicillium cataractarum]
MSTQPYLSLLCPNGVFSSCEPFITNTPLAQPLKQICGYNDLVDVSTLEKWQFRNRKQELDRFAQLVADFGESQQRLVALLYGPPGLGKTELAVHALKSLPSVREMNIFTVDGDSEVTLQNSFRNIANILHIAPSREHGLPALAPAPAVAQSIEETVRDVVYHLASTSIPWAMLVESYSATFEIRKYLPDNPRGIVVVCASDQHSAASLLGVPAHCRLSVSQPLNENELSRLFWSTVTGDLNHVPDPSAARALQYLIDKLGAHTLSVRVAANYFAPAGEATSQDIQDYMAAIDHQSIAHSGEINEKLWQAWQVIMDKLERETGEVAQDAREYFWLRVLFSHHHLPTTRLFHNAFSTRHGNDWIPHNHGPRFLGTHEEWQSKQRFENAERLLSRYGLLSISSISMIGGEERGTKMLKALHLFARQRLRKENRQKSNPADYTFAAFCVLGESIKWSFAADEVAYRHTLVPHVKECLEWGEAHLRNMDAKTAGNVLLNFAAVYVDGGLFQKALGLQKEALDRLELEFGPTFDMTLKAMSEVASTEDLLGESAEAMQLREVVLHYRQLQYQANKNDPDVERKYDIAAAQIALSYAQVPGRKHDAMHYREMVVEHATAVYVSSSHLNTNRHGRLALLKAKRELAMSYHELDRRHEAHQLREEVVKELGNEQHVFALNARRELLVSIMDARQFLLAQDMANNTVKSSEYLLGENHPDTVLARTTRAALKALMGENDVAKTELQKAVPSLKTLQGGNSSTTITTIHAMVDLAHVHRAMNEDGEAIRILDEVSKYFESQGNTYQKLRVEMEIAMLLQQQGSRVALDRMNSIILEFLAQGYPAHDPAVLSARLRLAGCFHQFGHLIDAAAEYERILALSLDVNGDTLTSNGLKAQLRLATVYEKLAATASDAQTDYDAFLAAGVTSRLIEGDDQLSVDEELSFARLLKNILLHCCGGSSMKNAETLVCPTPEDLGHIVYRGMSCRMLRDTALMLREEAVNSAVGPEHDSIVIVNQLTAQACHELADNYAARRQYNRAVVLQSAVVAFYLEYVGQAHSDSFLHQHRFQQWTKLTLSQRGD